MRPVDPLGELDLDLEGGVGDGDVEGVEDDREALPLLQGRCALGNAHVRAEVV